MWTAKRFYEVMALQLKNKKAFEELNAINQRIDNVVSGKDEQAFDLEMGICLPNSYCEDNLSDLTKKNLEYRGWKAQKYWITPIDPDDMQPIEEFFSEKRTSEKDSEGISLYCYDTSDKQQSTGENSEESSTEENDPLEGLH